MVNDEAIKLMKMAQGQLQAAINMALDSRYCIDVSNQLLATSALVNKANKEVLKNHLFTCVKQAKNNDDLETKLEEISNVLDKIIK